MRRTLICLLMCLPLASCGASAVGEPQRSGVDGSILLGPQCPVEQAGSPCPDKPVAAEVEVLEAGSDDLVTSVRSGDDGRFRVDLAPGAYRLVPVLDEDTIMSAKPAAAKVVSGEYVRVILWLDSGIR